MTTTTGTTTATGAVGSGRARVEGRDKVTGTARYAGEIPFARLAHGWLVLSTIARGRITAVADEPVLALPGVLTVLHHGNAPRVDTGYVGMLGRPNPVVGLFQHDRVPFVGWPVALVVAETPEQAREAAEALVVNYEEEPHDVAFRAGRADAYRPEDSPMVRADTEKGTSGRGSTEPPSSWTRSTRRRRNTTARWSRTPRPPAGTTAGSTSRTPTRAAPGWPENSPSSSRSTRPRCACAPNTSAEPSDRRA